MKMTAKIISYAIFFVILSVVCFESCPQRT